MMTFIISVSLAYILGMLILMYHSVNEIFLPGGNLILGILGMVSVVFILSLTVNGLQIILSEEKE